MNFSGLTSVSTPFNDIVKYCVVYLTMNTSFITGRCSRC